MFENQYEVMIGDCLDTLKTIQTGSVNCIVTSPPYFGLRQYSDEKGEIGIEETPEEYAENLVKVFDECWRVLHDTGTLWLNLGDTYAASGGGRQTADRRAASGMLEKNTDKSFKRIPTGGRKPKDLIGIPWLVAFALQKAGWYLRKDIIWNKPAVMPEPVKDRPVSSHEHIFLLAKSKRYFYDREAIKDPTQYKRDVWNIIPRPWGGSHFAIYPSELAETCILAGTSAHGRCSRCFAQYERITEKTMPKNAEQLHAVGGMETRHPNPRRGQQRVTENGTIPSYIPIKHKTVGWKATCDCGADHEPSVVLDPFGGSGTTAGASIKFGRKAILCELNPEYATVIPDRIAHIMGVKNPDQTTGFDEWFAN